MAERPPLSLYGNLHGPDFHGLRSYRFLLPSAAFLVPSVLFFVSNVLFFFISPRPFYQERRYPPTFWAENRIKSERFGMKRWERFENRFVFLPGLPHRLKPK